MDSFLEPFTENEKQQFCVEMMNRLDIQRRNEHLCDVILEVGSGDDQARLKAHRIVLSAASPFFYNALNSDMKEKKEGVIRLEETSKSVMEEVLEYLYTGHVVINEHNAYDLFAQADYFLIPSLKVLSSKVILQTMSLCNCIVAYYFALKYEWKELENGARNFILTNFVAVAETEDFLNLSSKQVEEWISSDEIIVRGEEKVFEVVLKWVEKNGRKKYQCFYDLFRHVRFIYVPRNYLFKVILPHRFVKDRKRCVDLVLDAMNCTSDGTEECFFLQSPRNCLKTHEDVIVACGQKRTVCYVPSESKWYELAKMPSRMPSNSLHYFMSPCHGKLFVIGGKANYMYRGSSIEQYDPSFDLWSQINTPDTMTMNSQSAVVTFQGFLYVIGGLDTSSKQVLSNVQKYNPDTKLWQEVPSLSSARAKVCAVADGSYLYAIGGKNGVGQYLDIVERFDPTTDTWDNFPSTLARRSAASGVAIKEKLFVFGGLPAESTDGDPCEMYDPATNAWSGISSRVAPRRLASAVSFKGKIFVFGAFRQQGRQGMTLQIYDIDQNKWEPCSDVSLFHKFCKISPLRILKDNVIAR